MNGVVGLTISTGSVRGLGSSYSYEDLDKIAQYVLTCTKQRPKIAIICGSGLGGLAETLSEKECLAYKDIPNFPVSTVPGHAGRLVFGKIGDKSVMCMQGRFHMYEGYPAWKCAMPVRVMKLMGVNTLFVTNAAGGVNPDYHVGDLMLIKDHINMPGMASNNPLVGDNDERFGVRFPAMTEAYDKKLRKLAHEIANNLGFGDFLRDGVYTMLGGPSFETIAELRYLRLIGTDAIGMSTCPEVVTARHCGMRVFGMSLITNVCVMDYEDDRVPNHEEVLETGKMRAGDMELLIRRLVSEMEDE
ncbi:purine nucleoside phosphorylase [Lingula anatina]|uniref:Purine nucleoside phosphorylase n=1 Tax=Lingula anatina TaxID=7574 RepID=A0A1S3JF13_LINAN|nr:purine nucleoside phosphorylase [Lingula anatina]|eukprot:XP_013408736.1 purine nucleoside phosphorylase [Lingula anatina]